MAYFYHCTFFAHLLVVFKLFDANPYNEEEVKTLLHAWRKGDTHASQKLFTHLYTQLNKISSALLSHEGGISLTTGDLVNEAAIRLINLDRIEWQDKAHFLAFSARVMRQVLIDHCRKKKANRRQHEKVTLVTLCEPQQDESIDLVLLEEALQELQVIDPKRVKIVEMRYYGGLSLQEIAEVMGVSSSTIKRNWRASRAWLLSNIEAKQLRI
jgi:RNA polymerase sigma factor (TIGR02999 family)